VRDALLVRVRSLVGGSGRDRGATVAEFAMISVLLVFLLFSVLQVAVFCYVRNVVAASPVDGARFAAAAGVDYARGGFRASDLVGKGPAEDVARLRGGGMGGYAPSTGSGRSKALRKLIFAGQRSGNSTSKIDRHQPTNQELRASKSAAFKVI